MNNSLSREDFILLNQYIRALDMYAKVSFFICFTLFVVINSRPTIPPGREFEPGNFDSLTSIFEKY